MATTAEVGKGLVELCRQGANLKAVDTYYDKEIVSVESASIPGMDRETKGLDAIRGKNQWWLDNHEVHSAEADGPFVSEGGDQFAVHFKYDVTQKGSGQRMQMDEMGLYTVKNGKVVREHFFYPTGS